MCSVCSEKLICQGGIGFFASEMQFAIRERGAGRKEFFRQREEKQLMNVGLTDEAQRALDEMFDRYMNGLKDMYCVRITKDDIE